MKKTLVTLVLLLAAAGTTLPARQPSRETTEALRARIEQRYDVVPLANGIALTPKDRRSDLRLVEVSDTIAINGAVVSGRELRERLGEDADAILQLSYMDAAALKAMFPTPDRVQERRVERRESRDDSHGAEAPETRRRTRAHGDRVRIFGNVSVRQDEEISGQAVAVFGSVRVDGVVNDQVVAVFGTVELGPDAVVHGDIVSVGGQVRRAGTAQVHGAVTEISVGEVRLPEHVAPWLAGVGLLSLSDGFSGVSRLIASTFRLLLMVILAVLAYAIARRTVENSADRVRENPVKATFIGLAAGLLIGPVLFITSMVLILTIIGIPLLVLIPAMLVFLLLLGLAGFSGTAYAIGQWAGGRLGMGSSPGVVGVVIGVVVILLPLMLARVVALGGWATAPFAMVLAAVAFVFELLVWSAGFGAVLSSALGTWQARRRAKAVAVTTVE